MAHEHDSPPDEAPAPPEDPNRPVKQLLTVVFGSVAINLLSSAIETQRWAWLPPALFTLAVATVVPRTGLLRREPHVGTRWTRLLAGALLLAYLSVAIWGAASAWPLGVMILSTGFLWASCVLVTWPALRARRQVDEVASGVTLLLVGVATLLFGVAMLLGGDTLFGVALLLFGVAMLLGGVAALLAGDTLGGVALLLGGVALLLIGVARLLGAGGDTLFGVALLLVGVALLLAGVAALLAGDTLFGVALLLGGVAMLLGGVAMLLAGDTLFGVATLLGGVAMLLGGVAMLLAGDTLFGVAALLGGVTMCSSGASTLIPNQGQGVTLRARITRWLTHR